MESERSQTQKGTRWYGLTQIYLHKHQLDLFISQYTVIKTKIPQKGIFSFPVTAKKYINLESF